MYQPHALWLHLPSSSLLGELIVQFTYDRDVVYYDGPQVMLLLGECGRRFIGGSLFAPDHETLDWPVCAVPIDPDALTALAHNVIDLKSVYDKAVEAWLVDLGTGAGKPMTVPLSERDIPVDAGLFIGDYLD